MADTMCAIDGCDRKVRTRGWCTMHYNRWYLHGSTDPRHGRVRGACSIDGCDKPHEARGYCKTHYKRWQTNGDAQESKPVRRQARFGNGRTMNNGYRAIGEKFHPLAMSDGKVLEHRRVLFDKIGPGAHPCHHCGMIVDWAIPYPKPGSLTVDHLDNVRTNNDPANLVPSCQGCNIRMRNIRNPPTRGSRKGNTQNGGHR